LALLSRISESVAQTKPIKIVALGDSLTAGFGVDDRDSFPSRLDAALKARGYHVIVSNAGVSGDTVDDGLARLDWALGDDVDAVIVALGANDALRGLNPAATRANLDMLVGRIVSRGLPVLVAGMAAPRNLGEAYVAAFDGLFVDVATKYGALFYPFFLDGVVLNPRLNQPDGIHPNPAGVAVIVERILPSVEKLVARAKARRG
jgi:acyl-CoA thioesterase-1